MRKLTMGNIKHQSGGEAGVEGEEPGGEGLPSLDFLINIPTIFYQLFFRPSFVFSRKHFAELFFFGRNNPRPKQH